MSSKNAKETFYEPIKIETTILKINVKTNGDLVTKEYDLIPFHPNMSEMKDLSNNNYILFPSFVKITMKDLQRAGIGDDYKKVFTHLDKYIELIRYVTKPQKDKVEEEDFTLIVDQTEAKNYAVSFLQDFTTDVVQDVLTIQKYEPLTEKEIITNNIGLIKSLFFPRKGRFYILGHEYIINKSKYIPPYNESSSGYDKVKNRKGESLHASYDINIELELLDATNNPNAGDFSKLSCKAKKVNLTNDFNELFGKTFNYKPAAKVVLPSVLTQTKPSPKRGFGKLQIEWEERNKYVKAPTNEKERLDMESKWTPLQKKMAKFDKTQEAYNKVPPLWISENKDLNTKYDTFFREIDGYKKEYIDFSNNIIDDFSKKEKLEQIKQTTEVFLANYNIKDIIDKQTIDTKYKTDELKRITDEAQIKTKEREIIELILKFYVDDNDNFFKTFIGFFKEFDKQKINGKYVAPFIVELTEKEKDVNALKKEDTELKNEIDKIKDAYSKTARLKDRSKLQALLLKKQTDYEVLKKKYGAKGEELTKEWKNTLDAMESFKKTVDNEKNVGERKIINESVSKELDTKLKEIKSLKEELLKAKFFAGKYGMLSKEQREKYAKLKPAERPVEDDETIQTNIKSLEEDYLEISKKLGLFNEIQGYITLLNDDVDQMKKLRGAKEGEKKKKDDELKDKDKSILGIDSKYKTSTGEPIKGKEMVKDGDDYNRKKQLEAEQKKLQDDLLPTNAIIKFLKEEEYKITSIISTLRGLKDKNPDKTINTNLPSEYKDQKDKIDVIKEKFNQKIEDGTFMTQEGGGSGRNITHRRHKHYNHKRTKRRLEKIKRLMKTLRHSYRKKKNHYYTRRH